MTLDRFLPNQTPDEPIIVFVRPYFLAFLPWVALIFGLLIFGVIITIVAAASLPELATTGLGYNILVVAASSYFLTLIPFTTVSFLDFYYDIHIVTNRRVIDIDLHGLFNREINELALEEIQDVTSKTQGISSNLFNFGDVYIETASANLKFEFLHVRHPLEIAAIILDLAEQAKATILQEGHSQLVPRGKIKGIINDHLYSSTQELAAAGAVLADAAALQTSKAVKATAPSPLPPSAPPAIPSLTAPPSPPVRGRDDDLDITIDEPT